MNVQAPQNRRSLLRRALLPDLGVRWKQAFCGPLLGCLRARSGKELRHHASNDARQY